MKNTLYLSQFRFWISADGVLKVDGEVGDKKSYDPRTYLALGESAMAERVKKAVVDLGGTGRSLFSIG